MPVANFTQVAGAGRPVSASGGGATAPPDVTFSGSVTGFVDPISGVMMITVPVNNPGGTFVGCHLYLEIPDQSSANVFQIGSSSIGGPDVLGTQWTVLDLGEQVYVASQQPWTISYPAPPGINLNTDIPCRLYADSYSVQVQNKLVQAGQPGATPNQAFTLVSLASGTPSSGTNVTGLVVASGARVGLVVTALAPDNSTGKLKTPFEAIVTDTPNTKGWAFQLVVTLGSADPTVPANQYVVSGIETTAGPVIAAADGISVPHSFVLDTPTTVQTLTVWLQAGLIDAAGNFTANNIVPGITPACPVVFGSTVGTTDAAALILASISATMALYAGQLSIAFLGVQAAYIANATITGLQVASATIAGANIGTATIAQGNMANASIGTAQIQIASIDDARIISLNVSKLLAGTISVTISITAPIINGGTITGASFICTNLAGSGVITDLTQGFDSTTGINWGVQVKDNSSATRLLFNNAEMDFLDASNNKQIFISIQALHGVSAAPIIRVGLSAAKNVTVQAGRVDVTNSAGTDLVTLTTNSRGGDLFLQGSSGGSVEAGITSLGNGFVAINGTIVVGGP